MEYSDEELELGGAFKICLNCIELGPDKPAMYMIPKGSNLDPSVHDRLFPIARDHEIPRIYEEYVDHVTGYARKAREKYGQNNFLMCKKCYSHDVFFFK